jgi:hypothetical protein
MSNLPPFILHVDKTEQSTIEDMDITCKTKVSGQTQKRFISPPNGYDFKTNIVIFSRTIPLQLGWVYLQDQSLLANVPRDSHLLELLHAMSNKIKEASPDPEKTKPIVRDRGDKYPLQIRLGIHHCHDIVDEEGNKMTKEDAFGGLPSDITILSFVIAFYQLYQNNADKQWTIQLGLRRCKVKRVQRETFKSIDDIPL